jgi:pantoate--beta-alanine ligase
VTGGADDADSVRAAEPLAEVDYVEVVDPRTLEPVRDLEPGTDVRLLVAARVGAPRLLDNLGVSVPPRRC